MRDGRVQWRRVMLIPTFVWISWCLPLFGIGFDAHAGPSPVVKLTQPTANISDIDVTLPGNNMPSFRILLPEAIFGEGKVMGASRIHCTPGHWQREGTILTGEFSTTHTASFKLRLEPRLSEVWIDLAVTNTSSTAWRDVRVDICTGINHLPGKPDWANPDFMPAQPLDRLVQGRYWFETVTPHGLRALTDKGWVAMHPSPDKPSAEGRALYNFIPSSEDRAIACAVTSMDGKKLFFQAWQTRCQYVTPCPGNACMHLWPLVARLLKPGETATIHGIIGILDGNRQDLEQKLRQSNFKLN